MDCGPKFPDISAYGGFCNKYLHIINIFSSFTENIRVLTMTKAGLSAVLCLILASVTAHAGPQVRFSADERFELTSIAAGLAGYEEYSMCRIPSYREDIAETFGEYRDHELIQYMRLLRATRGIAYDAVASSAQMLLISGDSVGLHPDAVPERLCMDDPRWTPDAIKRYVDLLDRFYRDTRFKEFFESHRDMYDKGSDAVGKYCDIDTTWFHSFFGKYLGHPELYLSFVNGPSNYALPDRGSIPGYGILMGLSFNIQDSTQILAFEKAGHIGFLRTVVHELCHNFSGPLYDRHAARFEKAGERLFRDSAIRKMVTENAYGAPDIMTSEWLNTLCESMYFKEHGLLYPDDYCIDERSLSLSFLTSARAQTTFLWLVSSIDMMDGFYADRKRYRTVEDYIPRIAGYYRHLSRHIDDEKEFFLSLYPQVTDVSVDSTSRRDTVVLSLSFSRPMRTNSYATVQHPDSCVLLPPDHVRWFNILDNDARLRSLSYEPERISFYILKRGLERGRRYGFQMTPDFYQSLMGFPLRGDNLIEFTYY